MSCLYYYKLVSEYPCDVTKSCKLTINEIDSNFKSLKDSDVKSVEFVRGEDIENKSDGTLVLTMNDNEKIIVPIDVTLNKNLTYDLNVDADSNESGVTLTLSYKDDEGENTLVLSNILTSDNLADIIGNDILTKVIRDDSLRGLGVMTAPLGIAGTEKTGMLAPAQKVLDLTDGDELPIEAKANTRYVTREYVNDYGYLYNGNGVNKINHKLDEIYENEQIYKEVTDRSYFWHVPTKEDWDKMLNSIEPCEYRNHDSEDCHIELGKFAGKDLKSQCGWVWQDPCDCTATRPYTGCTTETVSDENTVSDNTNPYPSEVEISPIGIDKYGMGFLPSGVSSFLRNMPRPEFFTEKAVFWSTTHVNNDEGQDIYVKEFEYDLSGVRQSAECPDSYFSVRLVKNYNGSNFKNTEYIDGVLYRCVLMPESGQVWLGTNFANKNGFVPYDSESGNVPDYLIPNNGEGITEDRVEMFINEYNGHSWEKRVMVEGDTIVIENPCFDHSSGTTTTICWHDTHGEEHCIDVEIPKISQFNLEYRVYTSDDKCDKTLVNTDDILVERILHVIIPMLEQEREERINMDTLLNEKIEGEIAAREASDEALSGAIDSIREDVETIDGQLIDHTQNPFTLNAAVPSGENNMVIPTKDGNEDHFIKIKFNGNFGEI